MQERIVVFDLEMLNRDPASICSIGIVEYIDQKIVSTYYSLVRPANLSFDYHAFQVHGIRKEKLYHKATFKQIWPEIKHYFEDSVVVSHDILSDSTHLRETMNYFHIPYPNCLLSCTNVIAHVNFKDEPKYNLEYLCSKYHYEFKSHNSLEDAKACGFLMFKMLEELNCTTLLAFHQKYRILPGKMKPHYYMNIISAENIDRFNDVTSDNFFTHKTITLVGNLGMSKSEFDIIANKINAFSTSHISNQTNYIILGKLNKNDSKKLSKAEKLIKKGQDIQILSEEEFLYYYKKPFSDDMIEFM